jgi:DNA-directed RNA polymerase specialized sigma24 family protein
MSEKERKEHLKRRLHRYRDLEAERVQIAQELKRVEDVMTAPRGPNMDGMPRSPGAGDPVLGVVSQHLALQERYSRQLEKLARAQSTIEDMIEGLEPMTRRLMRHRYIEGLPWEEVCVAIGYSWRQTHNLHAKALDALLAAETVKEEQDEQ